MVEHPPKILTSEEKPQHMMIVSLLYFCFTFTFYNCIVPMEFLPWEIRVAFSAES